MMMTNVLLTIALGFFGAQIALINNYSYTKYPAISRAERTRLVLDKFFNRDFFNCLLGGLITGLIVCYGVSWLISTDGPQHPYLSAFFFLIFALPFSAPDTIDDFLTARYGRNSKAHVTAGGISCLFVFLNLALGFLTFFYATITLATLAFALAIVAAVIIALYFLFICFA